MQGQEYRERKTYLLGEKARLLRNLAKCTSPGWQRFDKQRLAEVDKELKDLERLVYPELSHLDA